MWLTAHAGFAATVALAVSVVLGMYLRFDLVMAADFPVNDGGLFDLMTRELQHTHYVLPAFTSYNSAHIPFAHPPLGFYLAGLLSDATRWPLLDVVRVLPAVISTLTIIAFYLLAGATLRSRLEVAAATFAFAMLPCTFLWFIMGGGLARAPGFLFAILMLHQAYLLYTRGAMCSVVLTTIFASLTVLSHAENAWFAVYSGALLLLFFGRSRRAVAHSLIVIVGVVVLTAPWWASVLSRHGLTPFLAVRSGGGYDFFSWKPIKTLNFADEPYLTLFSVLGVLGAFVALAQKRWFFPTWLPVVLLANPRNPATYAMVPLALLVGTAIGSLVAPGVLAASWSGTGNHDASAEQFANRSGVAGSGHSSGLFPLAVLSAMLAFLSVYAFMSFRSTLKDGSVAPLPVGECNAMAWATANTADTSTFLVFPPTSNWFGLDQTTEWFPALTGRQSIATVQGYEWLLGHQFTVRAARYAALQKCAARGPSCLERWAAGNHLNFTHIHVAHRADKDCCARLRDFLRASPAYIAVFTGPGATIFARAEPSTQSR